MLALPPFQNHSVRFFLLAKLKDNGRSSKAIKDSHVAHLQVLAIEMQDV